MNVHIDCVMRDECRETRMYTVFTPYYWPTKMNLGQNSSGRNKWGSGGTPILAVNK